MEKILLKLYILPVPFQLTPARGRKRKRSWRDKFCNKFQLTPARGRKRRNADARSLLRDFNSPPRGDENPWPLPPRLASCLNFNSPPRGDENTFHGTRSGCSTYFNSPPRGDENSFIWHLRMSNKKFQLTPARGRKQCGS